MKNKKILIIIGAIITVVVLIYFINNFIEKENKSQIEASKKLSTYNNPIIPEGFKKVETDSASWELENGIPKGWNNGLVIEDEIGNQFVWVPVNVKEEEYVKLAKKEDKYNHNRYYDKDNLNISIKDEKQILKYEGFYIARYEAGISEEINKNKQEFSIKTNNVEGKPISRKNKIPWNYISWSNAKKNSKLMYQENKNIESDLLTYKQLGSLYYWLNKSGYNSENNDKLGNFSNVNFRFTGWYSIDYGKTYQYGENKLKSQYNMILSTGATERNKSNNIYDLYGNIAEYIDVIETCINGESIKSYRTIGGYYDSTSDYYEMSAYGINSKQGFRVVLYNK